MNASVVVVFFVSFCIGFSAAKTANYCASSLCKVQPHIACNNNGAFAKSCAKDAKVITMTSALKTAILTKHNTLRNKIASGGLSRFKAASRMATMQWNDELSQLAALNVKKCAMEHDKCRNTDEFPYTGQNLAYTGWSGGGIKTVVSILRSHIQLWFDENKDATMAQMNKYQASGKKVGHFVQMVVERATHVGCAVLRQTKNGNTEHYTACNYAFITIRNQPVYSSATKPGSKCTTGTHSKYTALCSTKEIYDVKKP